jgi:hypothetical protein
MKQAAGLLTSPLPDGLPILKRTVARYIGQVESGLQQRRLSRIFTGFPFKVAPHRGGNYQLLGRR